MMKYLIAFSGGLDSTVLLKIFADQAKDSSIVIRAIHIHHGLQNAADQWVQHCQKVCQQLNVVLIVKYVNAKANPGESPEAAARNARYQAFAETLEKNEILVTAHHQSDQAETLLLHLIRGAGPQGLAAMSSFKPFAQGWQWRPLLKFSRSQLENFAQQYQLTWIEDTSNTDISFDRNYLRHEVIPTIAHRWPKVVQNLTRVAEIQAEVCTYLDEQLISVWQKIPHDQRKLKVHPRFSTLNEPCLPLDTLDNLPILLQKHLLRQWLKIHTSIIVSQQQLTIIFEELIAARQDKQPKIKLATFNLMRYANALWLTTIKHEEANSHFFDLTLDQPLIMDHQTTLLSSASNGLGITLARKKLAGKKLTIRFRHGGEVFHPSDRTHSQALKKLLQEWHIPPWHRHSLPLLYVDDDLATIADLAVAKSFAASQKDKDETISFIWFNH